MFCFFHFVFSICALGLVYLHTQAIRELMRGVELVCESDLCEDLCHLIADRQREKQDLSRCTVMSSDLRRFSQEIYWKVLKIGPWCLGLGSSS